LTKSPRRQPLIAGNWKMNLNHFEAIALVQKIAFSLKPQHYDAVDVAVLPPFTDIRSVQTLVDGDRLRLTYGAQDLSPHPGGAYTGDIAGGMLAKLGCTFVVVGHSERRQHHAETDQLVNAKVKAGYASGLTPILCVGEQLPVREEGWHVEHCVDQLAEALVGVEADQAASLVIAYEPVWAIGTGKVATPADAQEVCAALRSRLGELYSPELAAGVRVLYGGSVKSTNAGEILAQPDVDGALVGGASLDGSEFAGICIAAARR
jgi:triosephosphate isomerase